MAAKQDQRTFQTATSVINIEKVRIYMRVSELKDKLNMYISHGHGDDEIVIRCKELSMGPAASEAVKGIYPGIDWDAGRLMIEPDKPLIHYGNGRDDPKPAVHITYKNDYGGKIRSTLHCPRCEAKLKKTDKYCPKCGQMLDMEHLKEVKI